MLYLSLKTLHIVAVVIFLGNITVGVLWKLHADASGEPRLMAYALRGILRADRIFTQTGATVILLTGIGLVWVGGYAFFATAWIWLGLALFLLSAALFKLAVEPVQRQLLETAQTAPFDARAYAELSRRWMVAGTAATLAPYLALALMVFKP